MHSRENAKTALAELDFSSIQTVDLSEPRLEGFLTAWANLGMVWKQNRQRLTALRPDKTTAAFISVAAELRDAPYLQPAISFLKSYPDLLANHALRFRDSFLSSGVQAEWLGFFARRVNEFGEQLAEAWRSQHSEPERTKALESRAQDIRVLRILHLFYLEFRLSSVGGDSGDFSPEEAVLFNPERQLYDPVVIALLYMLKKERKFRICLNEVCDSPFFVAERGSTRYCSIACSDRG